MKIHYHSDHLGSASFVTNAEGAVMQHLQYLPYGELFISQRNTEEFDSRYKFTAKELDNETSYTYFGARYYDSELSGWLSVDPMSDKYRADFAVNYFDPNSDKTLGEQLKNYFINVLNATDPENAPNYKDLPDKDSKNPPTYRTTYKNKSSVPMFSE